MTVQNSVGQRFYGIHFYPGVAEYQEPGKEPYRVFLNEDTLRAMDPSFTARPVYVHHVDEVSTNLQDLREEADGWVVKSFYNEADGKHWVEFLVVSDRGLNAIKNGYRLSNCYIPKNFAKGGLWNGVGYVKEIVGGEYEHLAIVKDPRYEESIILTPEEFKKYNEDKVVELKRLANSKEEPWYMKLNLFKRTKVENSADLEGVAVVLPKSGREITVEQMVNELDAHEVAKKEPRMANGGDMVEMGGKKMTVNDVLEKHKAMNEEIEAFKKKAVDDCVHNEDDDEKKENEEDEVEEEEDKKEDKKKNDDDTPDVPASVSGGNAAKKNELEEKKKKDKEKADRVRNAHKRSQEEDDVSIDFSEDRVQRGKARYGS